jgi:precorrin-6x reductase
MLEGEWKVGSEEARVLGQKLICAETQEEIVLSVSAKETARLIYRSIRTTISQTVFQNRMYRLLRTCNGTSSE